MKKFAIIFLLFYSNLVLAQSPYFSLDAYKNFLLEHQNLSSHGLMSMYPAGKFSARLNSFPSNIAYLDSVKQKMKLTSYETELLTKNGFVATERVTETNFLNMFRRIWSNDLPVFITTDAVLNALHLSYDLILKSAEINFLIPKVDELLNNLYTNFSFLEQKYAADPEMMTYLKDADLFLSVPRRIFREGSLTYYQDNLPALNAFMENISKLELRNEPIFGSVRRYVDYSQFKTRGHYTDTNFPQLEKYFKAMIWLGRIELYLIAPVSEETDSAIAADVRRQTIISFLISELINSSGGQTSFSEIENTIRAFVGEQDNVTLDQLNSLAETMHINNAKDFLDASLLKAFQDSLSAKPFAGQKILSQVLMSDPQDPTQIKPASAFLLFGQRFVIDSYVTGNVVYDRIKYNNAKVKRMLPSTLDILFAVGNSAAAQLLQPELDKYFYSTNLSSLRYLIDSYDSNFWKASVYNLWLNSIRALNPPADKSNLPEFMQTAAWWQQKMNTQLASWTELRHDNLLYAKQSYTGGIVCSFPYGYVEPFPEFFNAMKILAETTAQKFSGLSFPLNDEINFLNGFAGVMDTLEIIANKELNKYRLTTEEENFLHAVLYTRSVICGDDPIDGWYNNKLIFKTPYYTTSMDLFGLKYVVADYHTTPTNEVGNIVGWIKHSGTGPVNLCIVTAEIPNVGHVAFAGPVSSYYEYTTTNFRRLTDEEWRETYQRESMRPDWVNSYLADSKGKTRGSGVVLITDVKNENQNSNLIEENFILLQNYPNPFNPETTIRFNIPTKFANLFTELKIYNINGQLVKKIFSEEIPAGNYFVKWDGKNSAGQFVSSGVYIYQLKVGNTIKAGKMSLLK